MTLQHPTPKPILTIAIQKFAEQYENNPEGAQQAFVLWFYTLPLNDRAEFLTEILQMIFEARTAFQQIQETIPPVLDGLSIWWSTFCFDWPGEFKVTPTPIENDTAPWEERDSESLDGTNPGA